MTRIVADASAVGNVMLADERNGKTEPLADILSSSDLVEPAHWPIEACGLVLKAARRDRMTKEERDEALSVTLGLIAAAEVETVARAPAVVELALAHQLTIYDAAYLELAARLNLPLLTSDAALRKVARRAGVALVPSS